ncbi:MULTISPECIES: hypothetical protein [Anoxybacillaceae]|jgi:hypothetical protein|uniref:Uncharacterized protein n=1 Tax=Parageobacillus toebii TaxID=153151 RepID=A0A150N8U8_9BACL|nr:MULTISPECIES: hypothetical protein [Bacillaceae]KYD33108.1 hypothetical protein B4110_1833 [Parageobacillus toebii]MED4988412.1 hypothetical protein [Parageobacillus toebii]QSB47708.1 hypothetical protein JTI59_10965 [Parageobacillus toebii]
MLKKIIKALLKEHVLHQQHHKIHYNSSDHYPKHYANIHPSHYGHKHYKKKHHSGSFFSSFFGS